MKNEKGEQGVDSLQTPWQTEGKRIQIFTQPRSGLRTPHESSGVRLAHVTSVSPGRLLLISAYDCFTTFPEHHPDTPRPPTWLERWLDMKSVQLLLRCCDSQAPVFLRSAPPGSLRSFSSSAAS